MSAAAGAPRAPSALPWIGGTAAGLVVWALVYLLTDILYTVVDPRVRLDKKEQ